jgi:hypothetical protein
MRRFGSSPLFVAMAAVTLVVYTTLSVLTYRALLSLWAQQPDPATTAAVVVASRSSPATPATGSGRRGSGSRSIPPNSAGRFEPPTRR